MADVPFHVDPTLTAIAIGYKNPDVSLIADSVLPRVGTGEKFTYPVYDTGQAYTVPDAHVGRRSEPNVVTFGSHNETASVEDYGLDDPVPQRDIDAFNSEPHPAGDSRIPPDQLATMMLASLVDVAREIRVADLVFDSSNYNSSLTTTLSGTSQWSDFENSDPLGDLLGALDEPLIRPDTLTLGQQVWTKLRQHPGIVQGVKNTDQGSGTVTRQQLADLLEIRQVLVGASQHNTARKGQTPSFARVWGKHASLTYSSRSAGEMFQPVWGFTAAWGAKFAATFFDPKRGLKGTQNIRVGEQVKELVSAKDSGYFFKNAIS